MTGTATIAQLRNCVENAGRFYLLVLPCLVVIGMTSSAIRLVGREFPSHGFAVAAMASRTADPATMITGVIGRLVIVAGYTPVVGVMTAVTFSRGAEVAGGLARGSNAIVTA